MSFLLLEDAIRLTDAIKVGNSWKGRCPSHDDQNPSLSISPCKQDSTKAVVYCQSSCGTKEPYKCLMKKSGRDVEINRERYIYKNNASLDSLRVTRLIMGTVKKSFSKKTIEMKSGKKAVLMSRFVHICIMNGRIAQKPFS